jgi:hypothetical protein
LIFAVWRLKNCYLFENQGSGYVSKDTEDVPNLQVSTEVDPAGETFPSGQLVQSEAPGPLKVFSPHC